MKTGRPPKPRKLKLLSGTLQPCRDVDESTPLPAADALPDPPTWLPNPFAVDEYLRLGGILKENGLLHPGAFGHLALLAALYGRLVQCIGGGLFPSGNMISQYRALATDLGIVGLIRTPRMQARPENRFKKFDKNGRRPDAGNTSKGTT